MADIIQTIFKVHRGTIEAFEKNNPILEYGEPGFAKDTSGAGKHIFKIGDGETTWNDLPLANDAQMKALFESFKLSVPAISEDGYWIVDGEKTNVKAEGKTPEKGVDYFDGYTPQRGIDYYTEADKTELLNKLLASYPPAEGVNF